MTPARPGTAAERDPARRHPAPDATPQDADHARERKATFRFTSEKGAQFLCKLDARPYKLCASPKTIRALKPRRHVFQVKARDRAGNVDPTPAVKRFRIKRR